MIEVENFTKQYGKTIAVNSVSFTVKPASVTGLLGPNGAGKTTIMKAITGCHFPTSGSIRAAGFDVTEHPLEVKKRSGYLPENPALYPNFRVEEYLQFIAQARLIPSTMRKQAIEQTAENCSLEPVMKKTVSALSKGFRQRLAFAQAIIHEPEIIVLDEPTAGLDPAQIRDIRRLITNLGKTAAVLLSTHIMQEVEAVCSSVLVLHEGKLAAEGTIEEICKKTKTANLEQAFLQLTEKNSQEEER